MCYLNIYWQLTSFIISKTKLKIGSLNTAQLRWYPSLLKYCLGMSREGCSSPCGAQWVIKEATVSTDLHANLPGPTGHLAFFWGSWGDLLFLLKLEENIQNPILSRCKGGRFANGKLRNLLLYSVLKMQIKTNATGIQNVFEILWKWELK